MATKPAGYKTGSGAGVGIAVGADVGTTLALALALALGWPIAVGIGVGVAMGLVLGSAFDLDRSRQSKPGSPADRSHDRLSATSLTFRERQPSRGPAVANRSMCEQGSPAALPPLAGQILGYATAAAP